MSACVSIWACFSIIVRCERNHWAACIHASVASAEKYFVSLIVDDERVRRTDGQILRWYASTKHSRPNVILVPLVIALSHYNIERNYILVTVFLLFLMLAVSFIREA